MFTTVDTKIHLVLLTSPPHETPQHGLRMRFHSALHNIEQTTKCSNRVTYPFHNQDPTHVSTSSSETLCEQGRTKAAESCTAASQDARRSGPRTHHTGSTRTLSERVKPQCFRHCGDLSKMDPTHQVTHTPIKRGQRYYLLQRRGE